MATERLEPGCNDGHLGYLRSIAISLKRIANVLDAVNYRGAVLTQQRGR